MNPNIDEIIKSYVNQSNVLAQHQINSYNEYIEKILPSIISNYFPIIIQFENSKVSKISLDIINVTIGSPTTTENNGCSKLLTPEISRLRNYNYTG